MLLLFDSTVCNMLCTNGLQIVVGYAEWVNDPCTWGKALTFVP